MFSTLTKKLELFATESNEVHNLGPDAGNLTVCKKLSPFDVVCVK